MGCSVQGQVEGHLVRCFAGGDKPTGEGVLFIRGWLEKKLVRANANMSQCFGSRG